jgi:hypothetical protein
MAAELGLDAQLAQVQQEMQAMRQQHEAVQQQNMLLQQQMAFMLQQQQQHDHLQQQQLHQLHQHQHQPLIKAILRDPPQQFTGSVSDRKHLENWVYEMEKRFQAMDPAPVDAAQVTYAAHFLHGPAKTWYRSMEAVLQTWDEFVAALRRQYGVRNATSHAWDRLTHLTQTKGVQQYITTFQEVALQLPELPDGMAQHFFVAGLDSRLRGDVRARMNGASLEELMELADVYESNMRLEEDAKRALVRSRVSNPHLPARPSHRAYAPPPPPRPAPMDIGAMGFPPPRLYSQGQRRAPMAYVPGRARAHLNPPRRAMQQVHACPRCGRSGHTADRCPFARSNAARPVLQGNGRRRQG